MEKDDWYRSNQGQLGRAAAPSKIPQVTNRRFPDSDNFLGAAGDARVGGLKPAGQSG